MPTFDYSFVVRAPLAAVAEFHLDPRVLKRLTPPPVFAQMRRVEPLAEGSVSEFTLWFGPLPVQWVAVHTNVDHQHGFTDTQTHGPMKHWRHTHRFAPESGGVTRVSEHIEYQHKDGLPGLVSRLLFARPALFLVFLYRQFVTRSALER